MIILILKLFTKDNEAEYYIVKALLTYNKFSWTTWIIFKIFIKLTTYSMLKDKGMEEEASQWISDWGPLVNPFIDYVFHPVLRVFMFFNYHMGIFTDDVIHDYLFTVHNLLKPFLVLLKHYSMKLLLFKISVYKTSFHVDLRTVFFGVLLLNTLASIVNFYKNFRLAKVYRKVFQNNKGLNKMIKK